MLRLCKVIDRINHLAGNVFCYLILFMMLTGVYEVAMRYFFNRPTIWVWEMNGLMLCVLVALGGGFVLLKQSHVRVDILYDRFPERKKAVVDLVTSFFTFLFLICLFWQTVKFSWLSFLQSEHSQTIFRPPVYPFKIILAFGIFLFLLQCLSDFIRNLYILSGGEEK
jgi:TRAP-type mannitol/chloroaromatic compound transport system permease small subunit